jgi:hypothetical protein
MQCIHNAGYMHFDLEPRNVLRRNGEFRIIDLEDMDDQHRSGCTHFPGLFDFNSSPLSCEPWVHDSLCIYLVMQLQECLKLWDKGARVFDISVSNH